MQNRSRQSGLVRAVKKFFLSAFVVLTFTAYALENRMSAGEAAPTASGATARAGAVPTATPITSTAAAPTAGAPASAAANAARSATAPPATATATSAPALTTSSGYKDGTYTGPEVDVNWGYVQVEATIQSGKIRDVQFLEYPNDRRTSVRINSFAVPQLEQEAIQAQSARVDIITGATLTSEGFAMSLQAALRQAKS